MTKAEDLAARPYRLGVGIMLLNGTGQVFVARRLDTADAWQMPQGGIDAGETPREAAFREMKEEIGTDGADILAETTGWLDYDFPAWIRMGRYRGQRQKWFAMRLTADEAEIDLATEHPEFDAWQWVARERLTDLIVPFKRDLYRAVLAELEPRLP